MKNMLNFDPSKLNKRLSRLTPYGQLAFGAIICERLLPNYKSFQVESKLGDILQLDAALAKVWEILYGHEVNIGEITELITRCERIAPDSEKFDQLAVSAAQDACLATCCLLDFVLLNETEKITQIAEYSVETIDLYVQEIEKMRSDDQKLEEKILSHSLMQRELIAQNRDLQILEETQVFSLDILNKLRSSLDSGKNSNICLH